ncbi:MAG: helix-turn-helix domain-containing protein, partial [Pseudomonadota bacterium]
MNMSSPPHGTSDAAAKVVHFDIIVADGFVLSEFAAVVDVLRITNRVSAGPVFHWTVRSRNGGTVASSSEAFVETERFTDKPQANYLVVIGNRDQKSPELSLRAVIDRYTSRRSKVFLLAEAASRYIQDRGEDAAHLATHWENLAVLREDEGLHDIDYTIASEDGLIVTCAGMGTTMDVILQEVRLYIAPAVLMTVTNIFLHERIRDFGTRQPFGGKGGTAMGDKVLNRAIRIMQENIETPRPVSEISVLLGVSPRSLERRFRTRFDTTPNTYYRELRLARANNLLLNTRMPVREIGL